MKTAEINFIPCSINIGGWALWLTMLFGTIPLLAQNNEAGDSIQINPQFMKELDRAFSFDPIEAPIAVPDDVLTREQLHEWVGPIEGVSGGNRSRKYDPTDPNRFDSTYFALKMYLVDFCRWQPIVNQVAIPGLGGFTDGLQHYGKHWHSTKTGGMAATLDVNALSKYIRPSQIRLRKSKELAEKSRAIMDKFFPMEGEPFYSTIDTMTLK